MKQFDPTAPTAGLLGRYQPWHRGHRALADEAARRVGQVAILVRQMPAGEKNPFSPAEVVRRIRNDLADAPYPFRVEVAPNIVTMFYGRDVGWTCEEIVLDEATQAVSATNIRREMAAAKAPGL